jgi:hypothetical protein
VRLTDDELKRELSGGPLKKHGFDERLRRRIEERLDGAPSCRSFRAHRLARSGLALCVMIAAAVLLVRLQPTQTEEARPAADTVAERMAADAVALDHAEEAQRRAVLLLGLRRDGADGEASAYRTLLVAGGPEPSDWLAAEGEGIVMPHGIDFWGLDVREYQGPGVRLAGAWNASRGGSVLPASPIPDGGDIPSVEERILFAGNRYIAIARRVDGEWKHHMMDIAVLADHRNLVAILEGYEPSVPLEVKADGRVGVAGGGGIRSAGFGEWMFARRSGLWTAFGQGLAGGDAGNASRRLTGFPFDTSLVAHNELALDWNDIRDAQPAAVDAVTSPRRNMAAILTDRNIVVYSMRGGRLNREMLELELKPGETVVMAEWATHPDYVDAWIDRVSELFGSSPAE